MCVMSTFLYLQLTTVKNLPNNKNVHGDMKLGHKVQVFIIILVFGIFTSTITLSHAIEVSAQYTPESTIGNTTKDTGGVNGTIHTTGIAFVRLQPDRVFVTIGVETTEKTTNAALSENSELMNGIVSELNKQGLMQNETSTSSFNIFPLYNYTESGTRLNVSGFTVLNSIRIESSNLDNVSEWVDTAVALGANEINNIHFEVSNNKLEGIKSKLITDAIANAKQKAETAAAAVGLKVIGVESLNVEESIPPSPPEPLFRGDIAAQAGGASPTTPILAGEQEVSTSVSGVFLVG